MSLRASLQGGWIPLALVLLVALVFARAPAGGFVYDDHYLVVTNAELRGTGALLASLRTPLFAGAASQPDLAPVPYWRPFLKLMVQLQHRLFGLDPRGWHLVSLFVHAASVLLLWNWLRRRLPQSGLPAAALGTALFALHPSRVESVAWISGSADLWMTFWVLAGLAAWDRAGKLGTPLAILAFLLGAWSKEAAFVVPLALAGDTWWGARPAPARGALWRLGAATAALAGALALQVALLGGGARPLDFSPAPRVLGSLGLLLSRLFWPWRPSTQIGLVDASGQFALPAWSVTLGALAALAVVAFAVAAARQARLRPAAADLVWCLAPLLPVLNVVPLGYTMLVAERFWSLPLLGVAALAVRGLGSLRGRAPRAARAVALAGAVTLAGCAFVSAAYVPAFRSNATLWTHELRLRPGNPLLHLYAARAAAEEGRMDDALREARRSYELARSGDGKTDAAVTWAQLRVQAVPHGEPAGDAEIRALFDALATQSEPVRIQAAGLDWELAPTPAHRLDVTRTAAYRSARAVSHARTGDYATAAALFQDLLPEDPSAGTFANLTRSWAAAGDWPRAGAVLAQGLRVHPRDPALSGLRVPLQRAGALRASEPADPEERAASWAEIYLQLGLPLRARHEFESLGRAPVQPVAIVVQALADAALGAAPAARARIEALRRADPRQSGLCNAVLAEIDRLTGAAPEPLRRVNPRQLLD